MVKLQVLVFCPPLEQLPDQIASRPLLTLKVTSVPVAKLAVPELPTETCSPAGLEETFSPDRPVAVSVRGTVEVVPPPQTFCTPPPPQNCGLVQLPHVNDPPQPLEIVPQFFPWAAHVVGVHAPAGLIVSAAVTVPEYCAVMVAVVVACTADVVAVKLAFVCPVPTTTLEGTKAALLLLDKNTPAPPEGAGMFKETVPMEEEPPVTAVGLNVKLATLGLAAVPQTAPLQVWPKSHPHVMVPPHPSAIGPHAPAATSKQDLGAQPAVTVSGFVTGVCPGAPEFAPILTVVVWGTDFAA
jgi:hypothetical protein